MTRRAKRPVSGAEERAAGGAMALHPEIDPQGRYTSGPFY